MSKRLQVMLDNGEYSELRRTARANRMTLSEWVRHALRAARCAQPVHRPEAKLAALRAAAKNDFPTADMNQLLAEIERGYLDAQE